MRFYTLHQRAEMVTLQKGKQVCVDIVQKTMIYIYIYIDIKLALMFKVTISRPNLTLFYEIPVLTESWRCLSNSSLTSSPISVNEAHSDIVFKPFFLIHFMA